MASRSALYTTEILRLAASLPEPRILEREDGVAELRSPTCGSRVRTVVTIDADGRVGALSQQVHACAFGQASAALLQQGGRERSLGELDQAIEDIAAWLDGSNAEPQWPGISALAPARSRRSRHAAILLPFRTLAAALAEAAERRRDSPPAP
jgi:NifU-like protein involved in Fe-S cluster formation